MNLINHWPVAAREIMGIIGVRIFIINLWLVAIVEQGYTTRMKHCFIGLYIKDRTNGRGFNLKERKIHSVSKHKCVQTFDWYCLFDILIPRLNDCLLSSAVYSSHFFLHCSSWYLSLWLICHMKFNGYNLSAVYYMYLLQLMSTCKGDDNCVVEGKLFLFKGYS